MIKVFGIPGLQQRKKARQWLQENNIEYDFHISRKQA
jgi:arsenate reductase-like glutaredoxin family protein